MNRSPALLRISVAMCTYNGARYLAEQLDSFVQQQRRPYEVVICDDGSTDATLPLLKEFCRSAPFTVRLQANARNLGYSRNFAQAVELCTGDVIALSDQDDRWHPQKLVRLGELFEGNPAIGGIFSDGDLMDVDSKPLPGTLWGSFDFQKDDRRRMEAGDGVRVLLRRNVVTGMAFAFREKWRGVMREMPDYWPHDFWMALMLAEHNKLRACPERLVTYRVHGNQQIGVPITRAEKLHYLRTRGVGAYLALSRERNLREYTRDAVQFESLVRTAENPGDSAEGNVKPSSLAQRPWMPLVRAKALHMRRGVQQLEGSRARRWASALYHWKSYRDYAPTGFTALARDLML